MTWQADVARHRWRADILDYGASGHEGFGDQTTADNKRALAQLEREMADAIEAYENGKPDWGTQERWDADETLRAERSRIRQARFDLGQSGILAINGYNEPTDEELLGGA